MKDPKELFEKLCFSPSWSELPKAPYVRQNKDLSTLMDELEEIKNHIEDTKAKLWRISQQQQFNQEGFR